MYGDASAVLIDRAVDQSRKLFQMADCRQGLQFMSSTTGGMGSGFGCNLIRKIIEESPDTIIQSIPQLPSQDISYSPIEIYNNVLTFQYFVEDSSFTNFFDNDSLIRVAQKSYGQFRPNYRDMNKIVAKAVAGTTSSLRFAGSLNTSMRKIATNLIPFPRLHFFTTGIAPLNNHPTKTNARKLIQQAFSRDSIILNKHWK